MVARDIISEPPSQSNDVSSETGSWTPGFSFSGGVTGITYTTQLGSYVKIGKMVFVEYQVTLSNNGSSSGNLTLTGLPFASKAGLNMPGQSVSFYSGFTGLTGAPFARVNQSDTIAIFSDFSSTASTSVVDTNTGNTSQVRGSLVYEAAS